MYLLQKTVQSLTDNVWLANLISSSVVLAVLGFFLRRFIAQVDKRMDDHEKMVDDCNDRSNKIEKNYLSRFNKVEHDIDESSNKVMNHFTEEIKQVTHDKNNYRQIQALKTGEILTDIKHMMHAIEELKNRIIK